MQKTCQSSTSSVAWYKLAELVSRGEKEKVLNLYRLLSHSFGDRAYALQVEGDILWAFEDASAIERYQEAAQLYHDDRQLVAAIGVYEHLHTLEPDNHIHLVHLFENYLLLDWLEKWEENLKKLLELFEYNVFSVQKIDEQLVQLIEFFSKHHLATSRAITFATFLRFLRQHKKFIAFRLEALIKEA